MTVNMEKLVHLNSARSRGIHEDERVEAMLKELEEEFMVSDEKMRDIIKEFHQEMDNGLKGKESSLPMIPSYVTKRPTGKEKGSYLALDLGGTNLRVCLVQLKGDSTFDMEQMKYPIPAEAKASTLFEFIADCVEKFLFLHKVPVDPSLGYVPCGFTFSFPVNQTGIKRGNLVMWNKGFSVPNAVGRDVVNMTQDAFMRHHLRVKIVALVNDTVGSLMTSGYSFPNAQMGIIFGTGTNACYWEKASKIEKYNGDDKDSIDEMVINMEWGAFDNALKLLPYTPYDNKLNRKSPNFGLQSYEKMISGMYLGEVARNALLWMIDRRALFGGRSSTELNTGYGFDTSYVSTIVADESADLEEVRVVIELSLNIPETTLKDRQTVKRVCRLVGDRAKKLSAAAMCAVLLWRPELLDSEEGVSVGIDGSMYQFYPEFEESLIEESKKFLGEERASRLKLVLSKDGSGVGAAIVAMIATN
ncbi:Hexokinase-1 [Zancudomyces culisetae]|uniref:Phosphotransferase n=1 Tax=Zancudomyces culisetae TaxID=1213189 RepID=A0A1R1PQP8_ZANCU|nr:Hexokinase-1 [Zancudomyces culisetae]OMH85617.1 Hexokinase-1 [Zancudomyces culisetae]|eukprot:OMH83315.1 Hexokinase-1 [Zancudomyces culisetae]